MVKRKIMEAILSAAPKSFMRDIRIDSKLIARYGRTGPRYTSYPTTPHFSDEFTAGNYQEHVRRMNENSVFSSEADIRLESVKTSANDPKRTSEAFSFNCSIFACQPTSQ